jgi:hypothetical protein
VSFFLTMLGAGLGGLLLMALPGVRRHGHGARARVRGQTHGGTRGHVRGHVRGHARSHARGQAHGQAQASTRGGAAAAGASPQGAHGGAAAAAAQAHGHVMPHHASGRAVADNVLHYLPEPRPIFSVLALFGAFGNLLQRTAHLPFGAAAAGAAVIAVGLEWTIVGRLWRSALRFAGTPSSPLASLLMEQAEAVTAFRNGKGIVRAVIDGRAVQLSAELVAEQSAMPVRVGDRVTIQDVDPEHERVRVSMA